MSIVVDSEEAEGRNEVEEFEGHDAGQEDPAVGGHGVLPFLGEEGDGEFLAVSFVLAVVALIGGKDKGGLTLR